MKWNKPVLQEFDVTELTKLITAQADSGDPCGCTVCSCSCAAACGGIFCYSCSAFFIVG